MKADMRSNANRVVEIEPHPFEYVHGRPASSADRDGLQEASNDDEPDAAGAPEASVGIGAKAASSLPPSVPAPKMHPRHLLQGAEFWKGARKGAESGNSYLTKAITDQQLVDLYVEAWSRGPKQGNVTLSNGQTWFIQKASGKFFPVSGEGVVQLTQQEVALLRVLKGQISSGATGEQALANLGRAMSGQEYTLSAGMQVALESLGSKFGYSTTQLAKALAPYLPDSATVAMGEEAIAAAKAATGANLVRYVRWGGNLLLVAGVAVDAYEVYHAENRLKATYEKVGAWTGSLATGGAMAEFASPLLAGGPWGWLGYGVLVAGAGGIGYFAGGTAARYRYEWQFEQ